MIKLGKVYGNKMVDVSASNNKLVDRVVRALIALHEPLLIQVRRFVPFIGGMDFSPVIVILLLSFFRNLIKQNLGI